MLFYRLMYGALALGLASLLNQTVFVHRPAPRWLRWTLAITTFLLGAVLLTVMKVSVYRAIAERTGIPLTINDRPDVLTTAMAAWGVFLLLKGSTSK